MIEEHRKVYRISLAIVLAVAILALPSDRTISFGLILGIGLYPIYLLILTRTVTAQLDAAAGRGTGSPAIPALFLLRVAVLAAPLLIAAKLPQYFNILATFAPLFLNHILTYILYGRKEVAA
jgi:hypothetical protein